MVKGMIGGHAPFTMTDDILKAIGEAMKAQNTGFHIHVAEDRYDVAYSHHHYGEVTDRTTSYGL